MYWYGIRVYLPGTYVLKVKNEDKKTVLYLVRTVAPDSACACRMSELTRDGAAEPVSQGQILWREREHGNIHFPCSSNHEQDCQRLYWLMLNLSYVIYENVVPKRVLSGGNELPVQDMVLQFF